MNEKITAHPRKMGQGNKKCFDLRTGKVGSQRENPLQNGSTLNQAAGANPAFFVPLLVLQNLLAVFKLPDLLQDYLIEKEELAEYEELIRRLYEAISSLPPMQARRVHARYMLGMKVKDIAAMEGITPSQAGKSIHAALRRLRRYFARQKWTVNL